MSLFGAKKFGGNQELSDAFPPAPLRDRWVSGGGGAGMACEVVDRTGRALIAALGLVLVISGSVGGEPVSLGQLASWHHQLAQGGSDIPGLYVNTGGTPGALYQYPNFPGQIGLDNHDGISGLNWNTSGLLRP